MCLSLKWVHLLDVLLLCWRKPQFNNNLHSLHNNETETTSQPGWSNCVLHRRYLHGFCFVLFWRICLVLILVLFYTTTEFSTPWYKCLSGHLNQYLGHHSVTNNCPTQLCHCSKTVQQNHIFKILSYSFDTVWFLMTCTELALMSFHSSALYYTEQPPVAVIQAHLSSYHIWVGPPELWVVLSPLSQCLLLALIALLQQRTLQAQAVALRWPRPGLFPSAEPGPFMWEAAGKQDLGWGGSQHKVRYSTCSSWSGLCSSVAPCLGCGLKLVLYFGGDAWWDCDAHFTAATALSDEEVRLQTRPFLHVVSTLLEKKGKNRPVHHAASSGGLHQTCSRFLMAHGGINAEHKARLSRYVHENLGPVS